MSVAHCGVMENGLSVQATSVTTLTLPLHIASVSPSLHKDSSNAYFSGVIGGLREIHLLKEFSQAPGTEKSAISILIVN